MKKTTLFDRFVNVGDPVAQFQKICEVQSDKAAVEITSRFDGVVTKLYYNIDDVAETGKPLMEIDVADLTETTFGKVVLLLLRP